VVNLKKQSQFLKGQNERNVNYNKGIREIYWIGHLVKTNPIQSQFAGIAQRLPRPFGLRNDIGISAVSCLSGPFDYAQGMLCGYDPV